MFLVSRDTKHGWQHLSGILGQYSSGKPTNRDLQDLAGGLYSLPHQVQESPVRLVLPASLFRL
jgi:hypothetical protein